MYRLLELLKRFRFLLLFILLEVLAFTFLFLGNNYHHSVFFNLLQETSGSIYNQTSSLKRYFNLKKVNDSLLVENARLHSIVSTIYLQQSNTSAELFDTNSEYRYIFRPARVISNTIDKRKNYLMLNVGRKQGIDESMAVISTGGIIGFVRDVSDNYCLVTSVLNSDFKVNARITQTGDMGSLTWEGDSPDIVVLKDIPQQNLIKKGNKVVVGPYSRYFPENIPIGVVENFELDKGGSFYNIYVRLGNQMRNITAVYVIKNLSIAEPLQLEQKIQQ